MKKIITIVLAVVLATAAALPAFAAETNQVDSTAACDHSGTPRVVTTVSYDSCDDDYHNKYVTTSNYCNSCGACLSSSKDLEGTYKHDFDDDIYIRSSHVGYYTGHYYLYRKTCELCGKTIEWHVQSYCRPNYCVDPY